MMKSVISDDFWFYWHCRNILYMSLQISHRALISVVITPLEWNRLRVVRYKMKTKLPELKTYFEICILAGI